MTVRIPYAGALKDRNAIVTGSSSGIGRGIAEAFVAAGANVMLNGLEPADRAEGLRARMEAEGGTRVLYSPADMTRPQEIRAMVRTAIDAFGRVDILVNNAGIQHVSPIEEFDEDKWNAIIAINLSSGFHAIKAVVPGMKERGWGRIINIASVHALVASPYKAAYVAAKHGILGLTRTVALELAECGVTVNAICPGYVLTPLVERQIPDTARARGITEEEVKRDVLLAAQPTKRFVTVEQVATTAVFLATDAMSATTGAHLSVDGGFVAR